MTKEIFSISSLNSEIQRMTHGNQKPALILMSSQGFQILQWRMCPKERSVTLRGELQFNGIRVIEVPDMPEPYLFIVLPPVEKLVVLRSKDAETNQS